MVLLIGSFALLFATNWRLALHVIPLMAVVFALFTYMAKVGRPLFRAVQEKIAALNTRLEQNIVGVRTVKAFTGATREQERFEAESRQMYEQMMHVGRLFSLAIPLVFAMANIGTVVITWGGGVQILAERLTIGELVAFQGYLIVAMFPITMLGMIMMSISQAAAGAERIFEILDAESEVKEKPGATTLAPLREGLAFERVSFSYFGVGAPVLREVSFRTGASETLAIVRRHRIGQEHDHQPDSALLRRHRRQHHHRRRRHPRRDAAVAGAGRSASSWRRPPCSAAPSARTSPTAGLTPPTPRWRPPPAPRRRTGSSPSSRTATTAWWASAA